jgi:hypothetical protein
LASLKALRRSRETPHAQAQHDDLAIEMTTLEQLIQSQEPGHRIAFGFSQGPRIKGQAIWTRARWRTSAIPVLSENSEESRQYRNSKIEIQHITNIKNIISTTHTAPGSIVGS